MKKYKFLKIILITLVICIAAVHIPGIGAIVNAATPDLAFDDLDGYEWAADVLKALKEGDVLKGNPDGTFGPGDILSREQFAVILCRISKLPTDENAPSSFIDVKDVDDEGFENWAKKFIEAAKEYFHYSGSEFKPKADMSREEIVYSLVKVLDLDTKNVDTSPAEMKYVKDWQNVGNEYKPAVALATNLGFLSGDGHGRFNPKAGMKRVEMAVLLYRAINFGGGAGGGRFSDVKPGDWYFNSVMNLVNRGIVNGYDDGSFKPDADVKNKELPWWIARVLGRVTEEYNPIEDTVIISKLPESVAAAVYKPDEVVTREIAAYTIAKLCNLSVSDSVYGSILSQFHDYQEDWDYPHEIAGAVEAGYIKGSFDGDGNPVFNLEGSVTRAQMAALMVNALPPDGKKPGQVFSDVAPKDWYYDGIMNLYNRGIVNGYTDGTFRPYVLMDDSMAWLIMRHLKISRDDGYNPIEDAAVLNYFPDNTFADTKEATAYAIVKMLNIDLTDVNADSILADFNDKGQISDACQQAIAYLVSIGALKGDGDGNLKPKIKISRGEFAVFYARVLNGVDTSKMKDYENIIKAAGEGGQ